MGDASPMLRSWWNYSENKMIDAPATAAPAASVQEVAETGSPSPSHDPNANLCASTGQGRGQKRKSNKKRDSKKLLASYTKILVRGETAEEILEELKVQGTTETIASVRQAKKRETLKKSAPVIFLHISPSTAPLEYVHSIGNYVATFETPDRYHKNCIGFAGECDGDEDLTSFQITTNFWEWRKWAVTTDLTGIKAHYEKPENRKLMFAVPEGLDTVEIKFPGAPIIPESVM